MKFSIKDFFSKCDQIPQETYPHLLKKYLMENPIFCAVQISVMLTTNDILRVFRQLTPSVAQKKAFSFLLFILFTKQKIL